MKKRILDILLSVIGIFLLTPLLIFIFIFGYRFMGSPVFFKQVRPGQNGKPFEMIKFRTMLNAVGADGKLLPDSERMTSFGNFLRSSSLDELPELWNVLKGDMSIVGPRPLLVEYLPLYNDRQKKRHDVRPGITGWAQVNGRNAISWEEKFELDVWYVENQSLWLDLKIILMTIKKVFLREGISAAGEATMAKFTGSKK